MKRPDRPNPARRSNPMRGAIPLSSDESLDSNEIKRIERRYHARSRRAHYVAHLSNGEYYHFGKVEDIDEEQAIDIEVSLHVLWRSCKHHRETFTAEQVMQNPLWMILRLPEHCPDPYVRSRAGRAKYLREDWTERPWFDVYRTEPESELEITVDHRDLTPDVVAELDRIIGKRSRTRALTLDVRVAMRAAELESEGDLALAVRMRRVAEKASSIANAEAICDYVGGQREGRS